MNTYTYSSTHNFTKILCFLLAFVLFNSCTNDKPKSELTDTNDNIPALIQRNDKIQAGKEWDVAQSYFAEQKKAINKNPKDNEARLNLAQLYIREARVTGEHGHYYPAALQMCQEIMEDKSITKDLAFRTLMTKAGVQLSLHEFAQALETGQEAIALNDKNAQIHGVLVDAYVELGDYEKAVEMADKMIAIKPDLRSYSRISYLREIHGDVDGAKKAMKMAVDAGYPGYDETAWTMITLGDLYNQYGEPEKAKVIYEAILAERDNYPFAIASIADVHYQQGDLKKAEEMLNEAIAIIPEVGYNVQLAQIYKDQERTEEFDEIMAEIFEMLEDDEKSGHNMNLEYVHIYRDLMEDKEKALAFAKKEYDKRPENIDVNRALASVYLMMDKKEDAEKLLSVASRTNSKHPELIKLKQKI